MRPQQFKRQSLALFFIISLIPALIVAAVWYVYIQGSNGLFINFRTFVLPVIMLGVIPALILSFVFAELLARPVRRIHAATLELAKGNLKTQFRTHGAGEFAEIGIALDRVATTLQQKLSETASETALIAAERNKLRSVLSAMTDGVFALDHSGRVILFNQAASNLTGRSIGEVAGQFAEKVMPFRQNGELIMTSWLAAAPGADGQKIGHWNNLELHRADGQSLSVDLQAVALNVDPNGIAALVTFHDLTAPRQLEAMKIDFVALAAHELRTPLTEVKGYLDILSHEGKGLSKSNKVFLERAIASADRLGSLMRNLLNVSRIERGELSYQPEPLEYTSFIKDILQPLQERAVAGQRRLIIDVPPQLPKIMADATALQEVMDNLIENAFAHTVSDTGVITVTVSQQLKEIETLISDNGSGIPANALPHLFTKFYRVDEMKATTPGTGLGLYICKAIIETHGGHIWAESEIGKGSTFGFRIPIKPVASDSPTDDTISTTITRGAHGWIKNHSIH